MSDLPAFLDAKAELPASSTAKPDPAQIFLSLENDILAILQYIELLETITAARAFDDASPGLNRLMLTMRDHAKAIERGFSAAFESELRAAA